MAAQVVVSDEAFPYLVAQRGRIDGLKHDRAAWEAAYRHSLEADLADMIPFLPAQCDWLLDVGGGLGGIDILLSRHYGGTTNIYLVDGEADSAAVEAHDKTFSHMEVAERFMRANGVQDGRLSYSVPHLDPAGSGYELMLVVGRPVDLVVSLQAWCFHFAPEHYLGEVLRVSRPGTVLILDVRNDKPGWRADLDAHLRPLGVARTAHKFTRLAYAVPD